MKKNKYKGLRDFYKKHKDEIGEDYITFRRKVEDRRKYDQNYSDLTLMQSARKFMHSLAFTDYATIGRENIIKSMKEFGIFEQFRALLGGQPRTVSGAFASYGSVLTWDKVLKGWTFIGMDGSLYQIVTTNSPASMSIESVNF